MNSIHKPLLSVVVPVYNEADGLAQFHSSLLQVLNEHFAADYEVLYVDDGSTDRSTEVLFELQKGEKQISVIRLTRNFGKEIATTAGIHAAIGQAILTIDADGQHPVELIPDFVTRWHKGAKVVVGVRTTNRNEGFIKRYGSKLFYALFNRFTGVKLTPGATDFRLIDHSVQREFTQMTERNRITRGLIDWLGYHQEHVPFTANPRSSGSAGYSLKKLLKLAIDSVVSLSISPLYITAYIGAIVLPVSSLLGVGMLVNALLSDPLGLHATGSAYLIVFILFLVGILLVSQGIIGLYLSHIHTEAQNRPLYVIDKERSRGVTWNE